METNEIDVNDIQTLIALERANQLIEDQRKTIDRLLKLCDDFYDTADRMYALLQRHGKKLK